jgi:hypothetical protein
MIDLHTQIDILFVCPIEAATVDSTFYNAGSRESNSDAIVYISILDHILHAVCMSARHLPDSGLSSEIANLHPPQYVPGFETAQVLHYGQDCTLLPRFIIRLCDSPSHTIMNCRTN